MALLLLCASTVLASPLPVGRWAGELTGVPSGTMGEPANHNALLGNGYLGATLSTQRGPVVLEANGSTVDVWLNSNSNWDCEAAKTVLPPAVCSTRILGVLSIGTIGEAFAPEKTSFIAEQRVANGTLWTRRVAQDGSALETEMYIHPTENLLVVDAHLSVAKEATAPVMLQATLNAYGPNRHVRPDVNAACVLDKGPIIGGGRKVTGGSGTWSAACSRRYHLPNENTSTYYAPWSALAMTTAATGAQPTALHQSNQTKSGYEIEYVTATFDAAIPGTSVAVTFVIALTDNLMGSNSDDPIPTAAALVTKADATAIADASRAGWTSYWEAASVSLPTRAALETMWYGCLYATACAMPPNSVVEGTGGRAPPPGLYGPWTTGDFAFWNGDLTLDYNQEGTYFHVYSSNHPERAASYFGPILDWVGAARLRAVEVAKSANLSNCGAHALHFDCHLAPWGAQSRDTSVYGHYEAAFAAILFINDWEYMRNRTFATHTTLPLLEGISAFANCYLHRSTDANGTMLYEDWNAISPDELLENNPVRNPITALSLIRRVVTAHRDIAIQVGKSYPSYVDDIITHLVPPPSMPGPDDGALIWVAGTGVSWRNSTGHPPQYDATFNLFPLFPSETVGGIGMTEDEREVAFNSLSLYANLSCAPNWVRPPFESCVDAGLDTLVYFAAAARAIASGDVTRGVKAGVTGESLADALEQHVYAYGANATNLLAYAPGGGVETVGLASALNYMLVQSDGTHVHLFPAWPAKEPASFTNLRVKGAFLVSATWEEGRLSGVRVGDGGGGGEGERAVGLAGVKGMVTVRCGGVAGERRLCVGTNGKVTWRVGRGEVCEVEVEEGDCA